MLLMTQSWGVILCMLAMTHTRISLLPVISPMLLITHELRVCACCGWHMNQLLTCGFVHTTHDTRCGSVQTTGNTWAVALGILLMTHEVWFSAGYSWHTTCSSVPTTHDTWAGVLCIQLVTQALWFCVYFLWHMSCGSVHTTHDTWSVVLCMTHELWACAYYSQHMSCSFVHVTCNTWPVVLCILCMTHDLWFVHNNYDSWAVILLVFFHNCIIPLGFLLLSLGKASCDSPTAQPTVHAGCFSVSIIHQTLTWTPVCLTCAQTLMHAVARGCVWTL